MKMTRQSSLVTLQTSFPSVPHYQSPGIKIGRNLLNFVKDITATFFNALVSSSEPQIWQKKDYRGHIIWHTYDPITGYRAVFDSEQEVRIWLEERYNT